jgi:hypothetical protein
MSKELITPEVEERSILLLDEMKKQEREMLQLYGPDFMSKEQIAIGFLMQKIAELQLAIEAHNKEETK